MITLNYFQYFQFLAFIAALFFYKGLKTYRVNIFILILTLVCAIEFISSNRPFFNLKTNYLIYNLYLLISTPLYFYLFYLLLNIKVKYRWIYITAAFIISLVFLMDFLFFEGPQNINTLSIIFQQFVFILLSCFLLFKMAVSRQFFVLHRHPYFWIASGILIFSLGTLVVLGMNQFIRLNKITLANKSLYNTIMPVLNVLLYSSYIYAFYLCRQMRKSYSPL